jgi:N-formylglutamate deformylase
MQAAAEMSTPSATPSWLEVSRGMQPLIVSMPHAGIVLPAALQPRPVSSWLATVDTDWYIPRLYDFVSALGATVIRTSISRTVIDVNRDPEGQSLYPGQATTDLCPLTTFDGLPLYADAAGPDPVQVAQRRAEYFDPYHAALAQEIARLRAQHERIVVYDAHSIRSRVARLFDGDLPHFNVGTYAGRSCGSALTRAVADACRRMSLDCVVDGRFKGGYITRHYGDPSRGVHAIQMELAMRSYLREPAAPINEACWPPEFDAARAAPLQVVLESVLRACLDFAASSDRSSSRRVS